MSVSADDASEKLSTRKRRKMVQDQLAAKQAVQHQIKAAEKARVLATKPTKVKLPVIPAPSRRSKKTAAKHRKAIAAEASGIVKEPLTPKPKAAKAAVTIATPSTADVTPSTSASEPAEASEKKAKKVRKAAALEAAALEAAEAAGSEPTPKKAKKEAVSESEPASSEQTPKAKKIKAAPEAPSWPFPVDYNDRELVFTHPG